MGRSFLTLMSLEYTSIQAFPDVDWPGRGLPVM